MRAVFEWLGHFETAQAIIHTEFFRTALLPTAGAGAVLTGTSGILGGVPLMWACMATALVFMAIMQALLRGDELRERKSPLNKLGVLYAQIPCNLVPAPLLLPIIGNRQQRQSQGAQPPPTQQMLSASIVIPGVRRNIDKPQVGIVLKNNATFPISCILSNAETEIATLKPPRSTFPKPRPILQAGAVFAIADDPIDMQHLACGRLAGKMDMFIKYGLPGKEVFELRLTGDLDIAMEEYGLITQVTVLWHA